MPSIYTRDGDHIFTPRTYSAFREGLRWIVWQWGEDGKWRRAPTPKYWRRLSALRSAAALQGAFLDGMFVGASPSPPAADDDG